LGWTAKSVRQISSALGEMGHEVHFTSAAMLLRLLGYSLQANVKTKEGASHPDRDAQFEHINQTAKAAVAAGWPVISIRYQEEGAGRRLQEPRPRMAAEKQARAGARARLQGQAAGQGDPLWRL